MTTKFSIDLEPTYRQMLHMAVQGIITEDFVYPAADTLDFIRAAQKRGCKKIIITFNEDGSAVLDDGQAEGS